MSNATADTRAAIYARVSSEQQAEAGTIVSQVEALTERMGQEGLFIEPELRFIDEGYSGATLARPGLERLRDVAAAGAIDRLYVHCPDRLARKYAYQVLLVDELQRCGVELVFLNHELGQTPEEDLLLQVQGMVAEYERAKILERSRRGKLHAARRGSVNVLAGAPYGYRYIRCDQGGGEAQYQILLEQAVWEDVCSLLSDPKRIEQEYQRRLTTRSKGVGWDGSEHLQSRIKKTRRGIARLIDAYEDGLVDKSEFEPRLGVARQRLENLRAEAQALTDEETRQNELRLVIGRMQDFADKVADGLQEADWSTRRELLRALIKQIDVDKEEVRIVYKVSPNPFDSAPERGLLQHCLRRNRDQPGRRGRELHPGRPQGPDRHPGLRWRLFDPFV